MSKKSLSSVVVQRDKDGNDDKEARRQDIGVASVVGPQPAVDQVEVVVGPHYGGADVFSDVVDRSPLSGREDCIVAGQEFFNLVGNKNIDHSAVLSSREK